MDWLDLSVETAYYITPRLDLLLFIHIISCFHCANHLGSPSITRFVVLVHSLSRLVCVNTRALFLIGGVPLSVELSALEWTLAPNHQGYLRHSYLGRLIGNRQTWSVLMLIGF
jgi:hypothetical protein